MRGLLGQVFSRVVEAARGGGRLRSAARRAIGVRRYTALKERVLRQVEAGRAHECPVCESRLARFRRNGYAELICPVCGSFPRTRAVMLHLRRHLPEGASRRVLHVAPFWRKALALEGRRGLDYVSVDRAWPSPIYDRTAQQDMDLESLRFADASFDLVIAVSVIQFVLHDDRAFAELARVLRVGGVLLVETTIFGDRTEESYSAQELREVQYGIKDRLDGLLVTAPWRRDGKLLHDPRQYVRRYGRDLAARLERAGFEVRLVPYREVCSLAGLDAASVGLTETAEHLIFECTRRAAVGA
ncbi:MAG: methyltransferase domain-containing protein [Deltaproteobacteria bacterium]|nr:methyltransferase domain-containing protein [Deltaproteobacteria bacterium]